MIKNILVADDERATAVFVSRLLEKEGYKVITAADGLEALKLIQSRPVDLLITDVVMPGMDGVDLYMELKNNPDTEALPVIIVTDKEVFQESFAALGVELYCPKPFNITDLIAKIKRVESSASEKRRYNKVLVVGPEKDFLEMIRGELQQHNCITSVVDNVIEIGLRCFLINPRVILIDLHMKDYATTKEIIRSIRSYTFFKYASIVLYSKLSHEEVLRGSSLENVDLEVSECLTAGANKYIGHISAKSLSHLVVQLEEFGLGR